MPPLDSSDLRWTIVPKSDQLNAEQLLGGPITITVTGVEVHDSAEQPISIRYENDDGRPYKPAKTMRKVLIFAWGSDGASWRGKSMTLYNDPSVRFGGTAVGGIRISHMSDIAKQIDISLTATKGKKALHTIEPLVVVTLEQVKGAINAAKNKAGMEHAKQLAMQLPGEQIDEALHLYRAKVEALKAAAKPAAPDQSAWTAAQIYP